MAGGDNATLNGQLIVEKSKDMIRKNGFGEDIIFTDNLNYIDIMGLLKRPRSEFIVKPSMSREVRVICRWLNAEGGSVIEKLPKLMEDAKKCYPQEEIIFILDGEGYDKGNSNTMTPRKYLENEAEKAIGKTIKVWTLEQFDKWVKSGMMWLHINTKTYADFVDEVTKQFEFELDTPETRARIQAEAQRRYTNEVMFNR